MPILNKSRLNYFITLKYLFIGFHFATHSGREEKLTNFATYCALFTLLWLFVCYKGFKLMAELTKRSETLMQGEEAMVAFLSK